MSDGRVAALAEQFWMDAGGLPPPPRNLAPVASLVFPVIIVALPGLTLMRAHDWLRHRGLPCAESSPGRRLRGCLIAARGHGFLFVDGADPADEQRFTVAHEIAHFLLDHRAPRTTAIRRHGIDIVPVLDGRRSASTAEQLDAALLGGDFAPVTHLLEREGDQGALAATVESGSDQLAWELLAPAAEIVPELGAAGAANARQLLVSRYGLPLAVAARYCRALERRSAGPSFVDWLGG